MLPASSAGGEWTSFIDALFTAASSVCVTGLVVVDTFSYWSVFGQAVILILIQVGGLGVITVVSTLVLISQKKLSLSGRLTLRDAMNLNSLPGLIKFLSRVVWGTLIAESIGAVLYMLRFVPRFGMARGIWVSVFTAISAFCNAGMDILGPDSLTPYRDDPMVLSVTMALIVAGGLGFVVWFDICGKTLFGIKRKFSPAQIARRFSEHTKIVLAATCVLIVGGTAVILAAEYNNPQTIGNMPLPLKIVNSLFESVTCRTAGFSTLSQTTVTDITCIAAYFLMFIGGSPIGTAGGIKTTTLYLAMRNITSYLHGQDRVVVFKRSVNAEQMKKASVIVEVSLISVLALTLLLIATNPIGFQDGLFEVISACATVGLTRDTTAELNTAGKLIVTFAMYLGRIGPISMALFLTGGRRSTPDVRYAEGDFYIG